uniref:NADH-ubiquinone oxidoreductase chain 2 n=1 Tax=Sabella spallanzanii TaxID=85702 RepID=A0A7T1SSK5_SABSP|nr:NADH dehydrogenase subunit 2 [Sabella spallanzanii]QPO99969.1 NADH dehydrogenase subunit 2 [Sabella spallanzanii]UJM44191.1 NADH dehydrogenase subunit 2 [Sabella spallanzanii]UYP50935.1 NADH dehydrogenase subunit 2 [Sabella spallanzanii]
MMNYALPLFPAWIILSIITTLLGTLLVFLSSWWILTWIGLVMNLISIIPLITIKKSSSSSEIAMKYFILQLIAGTTLLLMPLMSPFTSPLLITLLFTAASVLKLGAFPFHIWVPQVMESLSWPMILFMSTWQKLAPLGLILMTSEIINQSYLIMLGTMTMVMGGLGAWTSTSIKTLFAYSSIAHTGWMLMISMFSFQLTMLYFILYIIQMWAFCTLMYSMQNTESDLIPSHPAMPTKPALTLTLLLLSTSGIPPFIGFAQKLMTILILSTTPMMVVPIILMLMASIVMTVTYLFVALNIIPPMFSAPMSKYTAGSPIAAASIITLMLLIGPLLANI